MKYKAINLCKWCFIHLIWSVCYTHSFYELLTVKRIWKSDYIVLKHLTHFLMGSCDWLRIELSPFPHSALLKKKKPMLPSCAGNWGERKAWELEGGGRMPAEPLIHLQVPVLPASKWRSRKWLSPCGGLKLWDPLTKSLAGRGPGPATLAMSSPGQASKYMDYWRANKGESCKQTCDKLSWYLADLGMLLLVFY